MKRYLYNEEIDCAGNQKLFQERMDLTEKLD